MSVALRSTSIVLKRRLNLAVQTGSRSTLLQNYWSLTRKYSQASTIPTCRGCGSPISSDPSAPGYFVPCTTDTRKKQISDDKKDQAAEIFYRSVSDLDEETRKQLLPIDPDKWRESRIEQKKRTTPICSRCHALKHHSAAPTDMRQPRATEHDVFSNIKHDTTALIVNVIDLMDFPASSLDIDKLIGPGQRVIHVLNRIDLLCKQELHARLARPRLQDIVRSNLNLTEHSDIRVISALKGWEVDKLANSLRKRKIGVNIYFVGSANAGKSSLISALGRRAHSKTLQTPVTSHVPGTTIASIATEIQLFGELLGGGKGSVIDLPGVLKPGLATWIKPSALRASLPHQYIDVKPLSLRWGETMILGDLVQIEHVSGDVQHILVSPYTHLRPHCTTRPEYILAKDSTVRLPNAPAFEVASEYELETDRGCKNIIDIVLKDVGFVSVALWKGKSKIRVKTPGGLHVFVRSQPLIENSYEGLWHHRC